jgi:hypothetical protein
MELTYKQERHTLSEFTNRYMSGGARDLENVVYIHSGVLFSLKQ